MGPGELERPAGAQRPPPATAVPSRALSLCQPQGCAWGAQGSGWEGSSKVGKVPPHLPQIDSSKPFGWSWKTDLKTTQPCQCILLH